MSHREAVRPGLDELPKKGWSCTQVLREGSGLDLGL
jgi:hypothetical protein